MEINKENLHKIAHLARLEVSPTEEEPLLESLNAIVKWVDQLNAMDTEGVAPLMVMSQEVNVTRKDIADNTLETKKALALAPQKNESHFVVPKVIG